MGLLTEKLLPDDSALVEAAARRRSTWHAAPNQAQDSVQRRRGRVDVIYVTGSRRRPHPRRQGRPCTTSATTRTTQTTRRPTKRPLTPAFRQKGRPHRRPANRTGAAQRARNRQSHTNEPPAAPRRTERGRASTRFPLKH